MALSSIFFFFKCGNNQILQNTDIKKLATRYSDVKCCKKFSGIVTVLLDELNREYWYF